MRRKISKWMLCIMTALMILSLSAAVPAEEPARVNAGAAHWENINGGAFWRPALFTPWRMGMAWFSGMVRRKEAQIFLQHFC